MKKDITSNVLKKIIDNNWVYPVYQPIVSLRDTEIIGYEALCRLEYEAKQTFGEINIEDLFCEAEQSGMIWRFDYLCRKNAMREYFRQDNIENCKLFLNVCPGIMADSRFSSGFTREYLEHYNTKPERIVFELTERQAINDKNAFEDMVKHYKLQGFDIAIDDVGSAHSGLERICYAKPHFIKLDMALIRNIHKSSIKSSLVRGLSEFALCNNICLLAEGIESKDELETLISLGVQYGQGYYLGYPQKEVQPLSDGVADTIREINIRNEKNHNCFANESLIMDIATDTLTVEPEERILDVMEQLELHPELPGVCVCRDKRAVGVLTREKILQMLGGRYGFSLYQKKSIHSIMSTDFLCVDGKTPIRVVAELAMKRDDTELYDFIVISNKEKYYGVVTIKDLLIHSTQLNVQAAKAANPLTGLPGNIAIENEIQNCLEDNKEYTVFYLDLDNFKAYNDVYGFEKGDQVIRSVAETLQELEEKSAFIGHIGGDDFVLILRRRESEEYALKIECEFEKKVIRFFNEEDAKRGYIVAANRQGEIEKIPLVSITIVGITDREKTFASQYELSMELAARKKQRKKLKKKQWKS